MAPAKSGSPAASIADRIREVRLELRMTQEDFADLVGVTRSHLASIETYRIEPSLSSIIGVLCLDLLPAGEPARAVDPTWLILGPPFEENMWGKIRYLLRRSMPFDDLALLVHRAQHGVPEASAE
ncbi:helix-turn-helix transcriptional regulator [Sediminicoccus sp. KRV36]|uniref:helix-turn-helix transcriptional regulator n=1 Tax=Sediminicoccus sp. KRV36 TaxID=3133721 RepID=UPI00206B9A74|nr:helix-turn-helix transcriptional regulator [Sediminicoccus rosea]UPY36202.1 helix-turn-helix domain-containing protein [Sediminicoccus rosea]